MCLNYKSDQTGDKQVQGSSQSRLMLRHAKQNAKVQRPSTKGCSQSLGLWSQAIGYSDPK